MLKQFLFVCISLMAFPACKETSPVISLAGEWQFALDSTDVGVTEKWFEHSFTDKIQLPGTTDEAGYGTPNSLPPSVGKPQILHLTVGTAMSVPPGIRVKSRFHRTGKTNLSN